MAIGARITSTNLSGKTATVTFVPYTGQTSGSTVNLGTKVVPFNHINSHPYGIYSLYFAEYDYTYTLTVPEPIGGVQMFVYSDRMVESDNYGAVTLNFNDFTAEIIDLDVNVNDWNNNSLYSLTESGYMYYFRGANNSDDRLVIFTDSSNTEIGRYSGTTDSFSRNSLEGRWLTAEYVDLGVLKYSDGISLYEYTWDPQTHYIDIEWDWDAVTSDGTFIIKKYEQGQWNYNGDGESYIVNPEDGTTTLFKTWTDGTQVKHIMNKSANFIVVETQNQADNYRYTNLQICSLTGGTLETISLTGDTYNNRNIEFHGTNKFTAVYYDGDDVDVDYKIIHHNRNTDTTIENTHVRGTSYNNITTFGRSDDWPSRDNTNYGGILMAFYNNIGYNNIGTQTSFCDFVYMLDNQTSFSTYTFANDQTKSFASWGFQVSDIIKVLCDNGDGVVSLLTIMSGSTRTESMNIFLSGTTQINYNFLGNKTLVQIYSNSYTDVAFKYVNAVGVVTDELNYSLSTQYGSNMYSMGEVGYVRIQTANDGNLGFYVYGNNVDFNPTSYYDSYLQPDSYDSETKELPDVMFLWSEGGVNGRILSSTGVTSQFVIPEMYSYNSRMGKDKFMIVYIDPNDNNYVKINLYNFSGSLLNSTTTSYTGWQDQWGAKDRFVVKFNDNNNNNNIFYLISEDVITPVTIQNYDSNTEINDWIWND